MGRKNIVLDAQVMYSAESHRSAVRETSAYRTCSICGFLSVYKHNWLIWALRNVAKDDGVEELVGICVLGN